MVSHGFVNGFLDQRVIVCVPDNRRNNPAVTQIQDSAEIDLMYHWTNIILELGHIRQPFLVGPVRMELAVQNIFRRMLWV